MKRVWQFGLILLVLIGITATTAGFGWLPNAAWTLDGLALEARQPVVVDAGNFQAAAEAKPNATKSQASLDDDSATDAELAAAVARAHQVAGDYAAAVRGGLYGNEPTYTVACVALDAANPGVVGRGINGIWRNNPSIFNTTLTDADAIAALYRQALTDQYLDELAATNPEKFAGKDFNAIKQELARYRAMIQRTRDAAAQAGKYYKNDRQQPSFEPNWTVENCAEIWAVRDALLQGAKLHNLVIRTVNVKNGKVKPLCNNCVRTFAELVKAMD